MQKTQLSIDWWSNLRIQFLIITPQNHIYSSRRTSCSVLEQTQPSCFTPQSKKSILVETDQRLTSTEDVLRSNLSSSCRTNIKLHEVFPASRGTIYRLTIYGHRRRSWPVQHSCALQNFLNCREPKPLHVPTQNVNCAHSIHNKTCRE